VKTKVQKTKSTISAKFVCIDDGNWSITSAAMPGSDTPTGRIDMPLALIPENGRITGAKLRITIEVVK